MSSCRCLYTYGEGCNCGEEVKLSDPDCKWLMEVTTLSGGSCICDVGIWGIFTMLSYLRLFPWLPAPSIISSNSPGLNSLVLIFLAAVVLTKVADWTGIRVSDHHGQRGPGRLGRGAPGNRVAVGPGVGGIYSKITN